MIESTGAALLLQERDDARTPPIGIFRFFGVRLIMTGLP